MYFNWDISTIIPFKDFHKLRPQFSGIQLSTHHTLTIDKFWNPSPKPILLSIQISRRHLLRIHPSIEPHLHFETNRYVVVERGSVVKRQIEQSVKSVSTSLEVSQTTIHLKARGAGKVPTRCEPPQQKWKASKFPLCK